MASALLAPYAWQEPQWQQTQQAITLQHLPHALLFTGSAGIGKQQFAQLLAHSLLCREPTQHLPCEQCGACRLLAAGTHPDLKIITLEGSANTIKIDQIRQVNAFLRQTSFGDSYRVVLIRPATAMTTAAANALLKILEEPGEHVLFILIAEQTQQMLPTVRSRCQQWHFPSANLSQTQAFLEQHGHSAQQAQEAYSLSQGAPLYALQLLDENTIQQRHQCYRALQALQQQNPISTAEILSELPTEQLYDWFISWIIDACHISLGLTDRALINHDYHAWLLEKYRHTDSRWLFDFYAHLLMVKSAHQQQANFNERLSLEAILCIYHEQLPLQGTVCLYN